MYACSSLLYQNDTSGGHSIVLYVLTINLLKNKFLFKVKYWKKKKQKSYCQFIKHLKFYAHKA